MNADGLLIPGYLAVVLAAVGIVMAVILGLGARRARRVREIRTAVVTSIEDARLERRAERGRMVAESWARRKVEIG